MRAKDFYSILLIGVAVVIQGFRYKFRGMNEVYSLIAHGVSFFCLIVGINLIYANSRDRKLRKALESVSGDYGDDHYTSGKQFTDGVEHVDVDHD